MVYCLFIISYHIVLLRPWKIHLFLHTINDYVHYYINFSYDQKRLNPSLTEVKYGVCQMDRNVHINYNVEHFYMMFSFVWIKEAVESMSIRQKKRPTEKHVSIWTLTNYLCHWSVDFMVSKRLCTTCLTCVGHGYRVFTIT